MGDAKFAPITGAKFRADVRLRLGRKHNPQAPNLYIGKALKTKTQSQNAPGTVLFFQFLPDVCFGEDLRPEARIDTPRESL